MKKIVLTACVAVLTLFAAGGCGNNSGSSPGFSGPPPVTPGVPVPSAPSQSGDQSLPGGTFNGGGGPAGNPDVSRAP